MVPCSNLYWPQLPTRQTDIRVHSDNTVIRNKKYLIHKILNTYNMLASCKHTYYYDITTLKSVAHRPDCLRLELSKFR